MGGVCPAACPTPSCHPLPGGVQRPGAGGGRAGGGLVRAAAGQVQAKGGRVSLSMGLLGGTRGGPRAHSGVGEGIVPGKHHPFWRGSSWKCPCLGAGGKCRAAPPAWPGFPRLSGRLLLGEVLLHPCIHPSVHPPTLCSCRHRGSLGSLQLQVRLRDETVLPSQCYQPLVQLLCQEVKSGRQVRGPCKAPPGHPPSSGSLPGHSSPSAHHVVVPLPTRTAKCTWSPSWMKLPRPSAGRRSPSTWSNSSWAKGWSRSSWTCSSSWSWPSPVRLERGAEPKASNHLLGLQNLRDLAR